MYHNFFIHSSVDRRLGGFHVLVVIYSAAMNYGYMCLFQFWFPQGICLGVELLSHLVVLFLVFKESPYHLPYRLHQLTFPPTVQERSLFSTPFPAFIVCRLFDDGHSNQCEVIPHCGFDLHFFHNERY